MKKKTFLIGKIDYNKQTGGAYMPILWDEQMCGIDICKSNFNNQYGKRITWLETPVILELTK